MRIVRQLEGSVWREYLEQNPFSNVFHTPEMNEVFARTKGYRPSLWATVTDSGEPLALLSPVQISLLGGPVRRFTSRAVAYGGSLCNPDAQGLDALTRLLNSYRREVGKAYLFTELRNLTNQAAIQQALQDSGFDYEDHLNYLIDLEQPLESIWLKVNNRIRKKIRRVQTQGEQCIREVTTPAMLRESYEVVRKTYANARIPLVGFSLFEAIYEILCPQQMAYFASSYYQGSPACTTLCLIYKGVVFGFYCGTDRTYSHFAPTESLWWHDIEWAHAHGYRLFDFGGAGKPNETYGVRDFKARFGGELVNYGRNVCVHNPQVLKLSKRGFQLYRDFRAALSNYRSGIQQWAENTGLYAGPKVLLANEDHSEHT